MAEQAEGGVRPHRRQYVLASEAHPAAADWRTESFGRFVLSHCPELPIARALDADGAPWLLLGLAAQTVPGAPAPAAAIAGARTAEVATLRLDWTGRWLLLGPQAIYPDASALLGCLYRRDAQGRPVASSSPPLIHRAAGLPPVVEDPRVLAYARGMPWYPAPHTRFAGVRRLLASQCLDLATSEPRPAPLLPALAVAPDDDGVDFYITALTRAMTDLAAAAGGRPVHLGLSAGYDSRAMLAVALHAGVDVVPYTRLTRRTALADRVLPAQLARVAGLPHRILHDATAEPGRAALLAEHAAGTVATGDALPFVRGSRDALDGIGLGGHGFGVLGSIRDWPRLPVAMPEPPLAAEHILARTGEDAASPARVGLEAWCRWVAEVAVPGLDWRARLMLEQRRGSWLAAKEQVYDMQTVARFPLENAARLVAYGQALAPEARAGKRLQLGVVDRLAPELNRLPCNPPDEELARRHPFAYGRQQARRWGGRLLRR
jgi:hypothetical protein